VTAPFDPVRASSRGFALLVELGDIAYRNMAAIYGSCPGPLPWPYARRRPTKVLQNVCRLPMLQA
jgi:hypothetical protein